MKKSDIERLERVAQMYAQVEELLGETFDSVNAGEVELVEVGPERACHSTVGLLSDMLGDAMYNRKKVERWMKDFRLTNDRPSPDPSPKGEGSV